MGCRSLASPASAAVSCNAGLQVLTTGSWPTQTAEMPDFPRECVAELDRFKQFYLGTHSGRKLTWQSNMGSAGGCGPHVFRRVHMLAARSMWLCAGWVSCMPARPV